MILSTHEMQELLGHGALSRLPDCDAALSENLSRLSIERLAKHGDSARFSGAIRAARAGSHAADSEIVRVALSELAPWRKGPFHIPGLTIDAEWNSNLKWDRVCATGATFEGHSIMDIGAGNGFYARKLEELGAYVVVLVEQSVQCAAQFMALQAIAPLSRAAFLILRAEQVPGKFPRFDTVLSMGVLYHVRSPIDHLMFLRSHLKTGGQAIVETIVIEEEPHHSLTPSDRYASMRNVWFIPSIPTLEIWLSRTGFRLRKLSPPARTTSEEQRSTALAPGPSLADALDPSDPLRTREGYPSPVRIIAVAEAV